MKKNWKGFVLIALIAAFALGFTACATPVADDTPVPTHTIITPAQLETAVLSEAAAADVEMVEVALWNNFVGRVPNEVQNPAPNGLPMWWSNWHNLRSAIEDDILQIRFRPEEFSPYDFDDLEHYFEMAMEWMGNWGEAIDMWAMEGIAHMNYFTIRMAGEEGGEENRLILHFQPNDGPVYAARFADLVVQGGGNVVITTEMQDIVIDLVASGFPGMTNRLHIRAFADATIFLDEMYFHGPIALIDATTNETIAEGFPETVIERVADLPIQAWVNALLPVEGRFDWNNFVGRIPNEAQNPAPNGLPMWWSNWHNLRASIDEDILRIDFRPEEFSPYDFDDEDHYFEMAMEWMGNWGEAIDMWGMDDIYYARYFTIRMAGAEGGEENRLILHFQPNDGPVYAARLADLVLRGGGSPVITTDMQDIMIDLEASGFPGMTNRLHIRAFAPAVIYLDELYFSGQTEPIDTTDNNTIALGFPEPVLDRVADLPIREWVEELE